MTRKWNIVNDQLNTNYDARKRIIYNTEVLKSNLYNFNNAYILVRGDVTFIGNQVTQVAFKNSAPFTKCITKVNGISHGIDKIDLVMPMSSLIEYSLNYFETEGCLWFYSKDERTDFNADIGNNNNLNFLNIRVNYEEKLKLVEIMEL